MITSTKNTRIVAARKLTQRKHRLKQNRFLVEGLQLLGMAIQAKTKPTISEKIIPLEVFYCDSLFTSNMAPQLLNQLNQAGAEAIPVAQNVMDTLSHRDTSQGLVATFALKELQFNSDSLPWLIATQQVNSSQLILILDHLQDPGNLGTLIRTADAVGVQAIILLEPCVDPFDSKTVRSTMGSLFNVPLIRAATFADIELYLSDGKYRLVGADANKGNVVWHGDVLTGPVGLILGNEARGLSQELHPYLNNYVSLPILGHAESLNVSIAGGVLMYEWLRVNQ